MRPDNNNQGQQFQSGQYQTPSYRDIGFTSFLERQPSTYLANGQLQSYISPFIGEVDESGFLFTPFTDTSQLTPNQQTPISGQQVQNGIISSNDGSMNVDLINGNINFTNGATTTTVNATGVTTTPASQQNTASAQ
jgi:hypothetical protein